jgi:hypothetical protein
MRPELPHELLTRAEMLRALLEATARWRALEEALKIVSRDPENAFPELTRLAAQTVGEIEELAARLFGKMYEHF